MGVKMKKFKVNHSDRNATYTYYLGKNDDIGKFILTILYYDKKGSWSNDEEIVRSFIRSFKHKNFFGDDEDEVLSQANEWVKNNLGENFTIQEVAENET